MSVLTHNALSQFYCNTFSIYIIYLLSSSTRYKQNAETENRSRKIQRTKINSKNSYNKAIIEKYFRNKSNRYDKQRH